MGTVLYFAVFAGLFFVMMRFGCGAHVMGHGHGEHEGHGGGGGPPQGQDRLRWAPPETDVDPVCRMSVQTKSAKSSVYRGTVYYFCSVEHRDQFETNPEQYVGSAAGPSAKSMEHHHD